MTLSFLIRLFGLNLTFSSARLVQLLRIATPSFRNWSSLSSWSGLRCGNWLKPRKIAPSDQPNFSCRRSKRRSPSLKHARLSWTNLPRWRTTFNFFRYCRLYVFYLCFQDGNTHVSLVCLPRVARLSKLRLCYQLCPESLRSLTWPLIQWWRLCRILKGCCMRSVRKGLSASTKEVNIKGWLLNIWFVWLCYIGVPFFCSKKCHDCWTRESCCRAPNHPAQWEPSSCASWSHIRSANQFLLNFKTTFILLHWCILFCISR